MDGDTARTSDYSHGTGMLGVTSGIRDSKDQHGIAFGSNMFVAKTGGSDSQSHGPFHDYVYWRTANKALVDAGAEVINSSWGSFVQTLDRTRFDGLGRDLGANGNRTNAYQIPGKDSTSPTAMASTIPNEYLKDLEYQYFFFKKSYSRRRHPVQPELPRAFVHGGDLGLHQGQRDGQRQVGGQQRLEQPVLPPGLSPLQPLGGEVSGWPSAGCNRPRRPIPSTQRLSVSTRRGSPSGSPCPPRRTTSGRRAAPVTPAMRTPAARHRRRRSRPR